MNQNINFTVKHEYKQLMYSLWTPDVCKNCTISNIDEIIQISRPVDFVYKIPLLQRIILSSEYHIIGDELNVYNTENNTCKSVSNIKIIDKKNNEHVMDISEMKIFTGTDDGTNITINSVFTPKKSIPDAFNKYWIDGYKDYYKKVTLVDNDDKLHPIVLDAIL